MSSSRAGNKRSKFAELRALRQSGKKTFDSYEVETVDSLYEEVDEDSYKKIVRDRLNQDDFVVDDNGEGYADDGREDWDRVPVYDDSESDGGMPQTRKCGKAPGTLDGSIERKKKTSSPCTAPLGF
jgi:DNA polymerase alpha subunit A